MPGRRRIGTCQQTTLLRELRDRGLLLRRLPSLTITKDLDHPPQGTLLHSCRKREPQTVTRRQARPSLHSMRPRVAATWQQARALHGALFDAAASETALSVRSTVTGAWASFAPPIGSALPPRYSIRWRRHCAAGITQIGRLTHALGAGSINQPVRALVFVGDACEEPEDELLSLAGQWAAQTTSIHLSEGRDERAHVTFKNMAKQGGATVPFDIDSARRLRGLLAAVARFARGGITVAKPYARGHAAVGAVKRSP